MSALGCASSALAVDCAHQFGQDVHHSCTLSGRRGARRDLMPEKFDGTEKSYNRLKVCLQSVELSSAKIIKNSGVSISRSALDRFKCGKTRPRLNQAKVLWDYFGSAYPDVLSKSHRALSNPSTTDNLFLYLKIILDIKEHTCGTFYEQFNGSYELFSRSQIFFPEEFVIRSALTIQRSDNQTLTASEFQHYDGRYGLSPLEQRYHGVCLPKSELNMIIMTEEHEKTPRLLFVGDSVIGYNEKTVNFFSGFIVSINGRKGGYFRTNFVARRRSRNILRPNIVSRSEIEDQFILRRVFDEI